VFTLGRRLRRRERGARGDTPTRFLLVFHFFCSTPTISSGRGQGPGTGQIDFRGNGACQISARDLLTHPTFYTCAHAVQCFLTLKRTTVSNSPPRAAVASRRRDDGRVAFSHFQIDLKIPKSAFPPLIRPKKPLIRPKKETGLSPALVHCPWIYLYLFKRNFTPLPLIKPMRKRGANDASARGLQPQQLRFSKFENINRFSTVFFANSNN
jgi:hypothetical protein